MVLDYSNYEKNNKFYNGRERKLGIIVHNENYMIKFQRREGTKKHFNHVSEYLGSHIFSILGVKAQEAYLGKYKGEEVVLIKDFNKEGAFFVPFNELSDLLLDSDNDENFEYSFEDVIRLIKNNKKIDDVNKTVDTLWDIYIIDALIANADRHGNNWGFIKKDNIHSLAPIYANDSSLFSDISDDEVLNILKDQDRINRKVYDLPVSPIKLEGKNSLYYEVISSLKYEECNNALKRVVERVDLEKINTLIDSVELVSSTRKRFYKRIIKERYEKILLASYKKLVGDNQE